KRRDLARLHELWRDREAAIGAARIGRERVGPPVVNPVDLEAEAQVLAGAMAGPFPTGLDQDRDRVGGLALEALNATPQLARGPQRVDELEVVVGQQRRRERAGEPQSTQPHRGYLRDGAAFRHACPAGRSELACEADRS